MSATVPAAAGSSNNTIAPTPPQGTPITPTSGVTAATQGTNITSTPAASPSSILNNLGTTPTSADPTVDPGTAMLIPDDLEILPWSPSMYAVIANAKPNSRWYDGPMTDQCGPGDEDCYGVVPFHPAYLASMRHYDEGGDFEIEPMTAFYAAPPPTAGLPTGTQVEDFIKKYWWILALGLGLVVVAKL